MALLTNAEYLKSKNKADNLIVGLKPPRNRWEANQIMLIKLKVIIEDLLARKVISQIEEQQICKGMAPYLYRNILDDPNLKNEKIKKIVEVSLLNDGLRLIGLCKGIRFLVSQGST